MRGEKGKQTDVFSKNSLDPTGGTHVHDGIEHLPNGKKKPFSEVRENAQKWEE